MLIHCETGSKPAETLSRCMRLMGDIPLIIENGFLRLEEVCMFLWRKFHRSTSQIEYHEWVVLWRWFMISSFWVMVSLIESIHSTDSDQFHWYFSAKSGRSLRCLLCDLVFRRLIWHPKSIISILSRFTWWDNLLRITGDQYRPKFVVAGYIAWYGHCIIASRLTLGSAVS